MASSNYLKNFKFHAKKTLPDWQYNALHQKAKSIAGGIAKAKKIKSLKKEQPGSSDIHVPVPMGNLPKKKKLKKSAVPDAATANDAEPRSYPDSSKPEVPSDSALAMDSLGYNYDDDENGDENRKLGYASQGAAESLSDFELVKIALESPDDEDEMDLVMRVCKADQKKQILYCVALEPGSSDAQEDVMTLDDIEEAAHNYLIESRVVSSRHEKQIDGVPVESYIAPCDFEMTGPYGTQLVKLGSWVIGLKILDPDEWEKVESGFYQGVSVGGFGLRRKI